MAKTNLNTENIDKKFDELNNRVGHLSEFISHFGTGLLAGIFITAMIQLIIAPISYSNQVISYAGYVLFSSVPVYAYILYIIMIFAILIALVVIGSVFFFRGSIIQYVLLPYDGKYEDVYAKIKMVLEQRIENLSEFKVEGNSFEHYFAVVSTKSKSIFNKTNDSDTVDILRINFDVKEHKITVAFNQYEARSTDLLLFLKNVNNQNAESKKDKDNRNKDERSLG